MRVVVIGGGVIGLCCAVSLAAPLGGSGVVRTGVRSALDPSGALVVR